VDGVITLCIYDLSIVAGYSWAGTKTVGFRTFAFIALGNNRPSFVIYGRVNETGRTYVIKPVRTAREPWFLEYGCHVTAKSRMILMASPPIDWNKLNLDTLRVLTPLLKVGERRLKFHHRGCRRRWGDYLGFEECFFYCAPQNAGGFEKD